MGQAKQRGSYAERHQAALARNKMLEEQLPADAVDLRKFQKQHGTQRLATRLVAAGIIGIPGLNK